MLRLFSKLIITRQHLTCGSAGHTAGYWVVAPSTVLPSCCPFVAWATHSAAHHIYTCRGCHAHRYSLGQKFGRHIDDSVEVAPGQFTGYTLLIYLSGQLDRGTPSNSKSTNTSSRPATAASSSSSSSSSSRRGKQKAAGPSAPTQVVPLNTSAVQDLVGGETVFYGEYKWPPLIMALLSCCINAAAEPCIWGIICKNRMRICLWSSNWACMFCVAVLCNKSRSNSELTSSAAFVY